MSDFSRYLIKDYKYWELTIHQNQGYLGRLVVWCKREDAMDLTQVTSDEYNELLVVIKEVREVLTGLFHPDWFNYAFLGNEVRHLHGHVVPRYASTREFGGLVFEDKLYGHNFQTDPSFSISEEAILKIKEAIAKEFV